MTRKQLPLIRRIHEKMASPTEDSGRGTDPRPQTESSEVRHQTDWILERIRRTSAQFLSMAEHGSLANAESHANRVIRKQQALLLAYKLMLTAWRRRGEAHGSALVDAVRHRVLRELDGIESALAREPGADRRPPAPDERAARLLRIRKTLIDPADSDIAASMIRFEAGLPGPLTPFYGDLAPAFGGPCPSEMLSPRYGKTVRHLYDTIQRKLDERDRGATGARADGRARAAHP